MHVIIEEQFRSIIEDELKDRGWSRSDLAREMHVGRQVVTDYLNGRSKPGPDMMEKFFAALELEPQLTVKKKPTSTKVPVHA